MGTSTRDLEQLLARAIDGDMDAFGQLYHATSAKLFGNDLRQLEICLGGLDDDRRTMVRLAYLDGFSRAELAERFAQPVGTIKTWLHRSLKQLKECLGS